MVRLLEGIRLERTQVQLQCLLGAISLNLVRKVVYFLHFDLSFGEVLLPGLVKHLQQASLRLKIDDPSGIPACLLFYLLNELPELAGKVVIQRAIISLIDHLRVGTAKLPECIVRAGQPHDSFVIDPMLLEEGLVVGYVAVAWVLECLILGSRQFEWERWAVGALKTCRQAAPSEFPLAFGDGAELTAA